MGIQELWWDCRTAVNTAGLSAARNQAEQVVFRLVCLAPGLGKLLGNWAVTGSFPCPGFWAACDAQMFLTSASESRALALQLWGLRQTMLALDSQFLKHNLPLPCNSLMFFFLLSPLLQFLFGIFSAFLFPAIPCFFFLLSPLLQFRGFFFLLSTLLQFLVVFLLQERGKQILIGVFFCFPLPCNFLLVSFAFLSPEIPCWLFFLLSPSLQFLVGFFFCFPLPAIPCWLFFFPLSCNSLLVSFAFLPPCNSLLGFFFFLLSPPCNSFLVFFCFPTLGYNPVLQVKFIQTKQEDLEKELQMWCLWSLEHKCAWAGGTSSSPPSPWTAPENFFQNLFGTQDALS